MIIENCSISISQFKDITLTTLHMGIHAGVVYTCAAICLIFMCSAVIGVIIKEKSKKGGKK